MTEQPRRRREAVRPAEQYNMAVQFYNQELSTISQRNSAFLIVQSILVVALATFLGNAEKFPYALVIIVWGICLFGGLFCYFNNVSGKTGAQAASLWRRYMYLIEKHKRGTPWTQFSAYCEDDNHRKHVDIPPWRNIVCRLWNLRARLRCGRCLLDRAPLPSKWIITPAMFSGLWLVVSVYIIVRSFMPCDPLFLYLPSYMSLCYAQLISIAVAVVVFIFLCCILWCFWVWWRTKSSS